MCFYVDSLCGRVTKVLQCITLPPYLLKNTNERAPLGPKVVALSHHHYPLLSGEKVMMKIGSSKE